MKQNDRRPPTPPPSNPATDLIRYVDKYEACGSCYGLGTVAFKEHEANGTVRTSRIPCSVCNGQKLLFVAREVTYMKPAPKAAAEQPTQQAKPADKPVVVSLNAERERRRQEAERRSPALDPPVA